MIFRYFSFFSLSKNLVIFFYLSLSLTFVFLLCIFYPVFNTHKKKNSLSFIATPHSVHVRNLTVAWHNHHQLLFFKIIKK